MAGNSPTLTNENYHMFEPSPIETSLASSVDNPATPSAFPLLMMYRGQNQDAANQYQQQLNSMHQIQQQEAQANQLTARAGVFDTTLKNLTQPGQVSMAQQMGLIPAGVDTSQFVQNLSDASSAKNLEGAGRGGGALAASGMTGIDNSDVLKHLIPGLGQGPAPLVQAAGINAAGRVQAAGISGGGVTYSAPIPKPDGTYDPLGPTAHWKQPGGTAPVIPGSTSLPQAPSSTPSASVGSAPSIPAMQARITAALPSVQSSGPSGPSTHADIVAGSVNGKPNVVFDANHNAYVIQGKNNQYPVAPFLK